MKFTREIQGGNTYLVYQIQPEDQIDTLSLGMIVNNKIEGIAPTIYNQMDSRKFLKYNISAKVSLEQFFTGTVNRQRLLSVIDSILEGITAAEDYMLESKTLLLYPSYIFVDVSTGRAVLLCVPTLDMRVESIDPGTFFKAIMFNTRFDQSENGDYIAKIISYLNSTAEISVADFKQLVKGLLQETEESVLPEASQTQFLNKISVALPYTPNVAMTDNAQSNGKPPLNDSPMMHNSGMSNNGILSDNRQLANNEQAEAAQPQGNLPQPAVRQAADVDMGFAIPGGGMEIPKSGGKKEKKKKEKKQKESILTEKPPKEKKLFGLFGKKKKEKEEAFQPSATPIPQTVPVVPASIPIPQTAPVVSASTPIPQTAPVAPVKTVSIEESQNHYAGMNFQTGGIGETTVLGNAASGETVVLSGLNPDGQPNPRLTRVRNKEQITINKPIFRIGKERSYVDYFIGDNPAISRSHANIVIQQNGYYIEDTNSTNHTYVNDKMIVSGSAVKLEQGAKVRLGNEEFIFQY